MRFHELDWWDERHLRVALSSSSTDGPAVDAEVRLSCTLSQHNLSRGLFTDFARSGDPGSSRTSAHTRGLILLATPRIGPSATTDGTASGEEHQDDNVLVCPAFWRLRSRVTAHWCVSHYMPRPNAPGASLFVRDLTPIWCSSAYSPHSIMSSMHASPADAVRISRDVRAKKALVMHWG